MKGWLVLGLRWLGSVAGKVTELFDGGMIYDGGIAGGGMSAARKKRVLRMVKALLWTFVTLLRT